MSRRAWSNSPYPRPRETGVAYLIHFSEPVGHARHYKGFTRRDLPARLADHINGRGARLLQVANERGVTWKLARIWPGVTREKENQIKLAGGARQCPECKGKPLSKEELTPPTRYGKQLITKGNTMTSTPREPAVEAEKGAEAAERLITAQMAAGFGPDRIAESHERILSDYDPAKPGSAAQQAWHNAYVTTAASMIAGYREQEIAGRGGEHGQDEEPDPRLVEWRANYEAGREPVTQQEADQQEEWGKQETPGRWEVTDAEQQAEWDEQDRQEQAGRDAETQRFLALPERDQQAEAEARGWSLSGQERELEEREAG